MYQVEKRHQDSGTKFKQQNLLDSNKNRAMELLKQQQRQFNQNKKSNQKQIDYLDRLTLQKRIFDNKQALLMSGIKKDIVNNPNSKSSQKTGTFKKNEINFDKHNDNTIAKFSSFRNTFGKRKTKLPLMQNTKAETFAKNIEKKPFDRKTDFNEAKGEQKYNKLFSKIQKKLISEFDNVAKYHKPKQFSNSSEKTTDTSKPNILNVKFNDKQNKAFLQKVKNKKSIQTKQFDRKTAFDEVLQESKYNENLKKSNMKTKNIELLLSEQKYNAQ